jgi:hypothetical protein
MTEIHFYSLGPLTGIVSAGEWTASYLDVSIGNVCSASHRITHETVELDFKSWWIATTEAHVPATMQKVPHRIRRMFQAKSNLKVVLLRSDLVQLSQIHMIPIIILLREGTPH